MPDIATLTAQLEPYLSSQLGTATRITDMRRISVGHSRAMFAVTTGEGFRFVLRMEQGGVFGTSGAEEFRIMRSLAERGFPVAKVRWSQTTGAVLGQPFFVMDFLEGGQAADERAVDAPTAAAFVRTIAQLHALDPAGFEFDLQPDAVSATHAQIDRWAGVYRGTLDGGGEPDPLLEEAAAWLHHHAPPLGRLAIVHGDAGPGNFVHRNGAVVAITDWEFAHLGDPAEDWSYCLAMRGSRTMSRDQWLQLFRSEAGVEMSEGQWCFWEAFNLFKGACANRTCLPLFVSGTNRAPNMAIIGTHLHQVFLRRLVDLTVQ
jgi:aminoglycoside phosphotransferase (APT) family kinase protein